MFQRSKPNSISPVWVARVRNYLYSGGRTASAWARDHGYPANAVIKIANGLLRARWGRSYQIAQALDADIAAQRGKGAR